MQAGDRVVINDTVPTAPWTGGMDSITLERQIEAYHGRVAQIDHINSDGSLDILHPADNPDTESDNFPPEGVTPVDPGQ